MARIKNLYELAYRRRNFFSLFLFLSRFSCEFHRAPNKIAKKVAKEREKERKREREREERKDEEYNGIENGQMHMQRGANDYTESRLIGWIVKSDEYTVISYE